MKKKANSDIWFSPEKLNRNMRTLIDRFEMNFSEIAKQTHTTHTTIKRMASDPTINPTINTLMSIANFFNISLAQLIGFEPLPQQKNIGISSLNLNQEIPVIKFEDVPSWLSGEKIEISEFISTDYLGDKKTFSCRLPEDFEGFQKGSFVIADPAIKPSKKCYVIANKKGYHPSLKLYIQNESKQYLKLLDGISTPDLIDKNDDIIFGVVTRTNYN